jgi:hypothetical protein
MEEEQQCEECEQEADDGCPHVPLEIWEMILSYFRPGGEHRAKVFCQGWAEIIYRRIDIRVERDLEVIRRACFITGEESDERFSRNGTVAQFLRLVARFSPPEFFDIIVERLLEMPCKNIAGKTMGEIVDEMMTFEHVWRGDYNPETPGAVAAHIRAVRDTRAQRVRDLMIAHLGGSGPA